MNDNDTILYLLVGVVAVGFLILLLFGLVQFINDFTRELKYVNNEIGRTYGREKRYWLARRKRLWLSLIPFIKYEE